MKKELVKVKAHLTSRLNSLNEQKKSASLNDEQKAKVDEAINSVTDALAELDAAEAEATNEQLLAVFAKASEAFAASATASAEAVEAKLQAQISKMQAKIEKGVGAPKKVTARLSLKTLKAAAGSKDEFKSFSAGVDVTAFTPEAEIENVEIYHTLIGIAGGFEVSATGKTSIKVRTMEKGSGAAAVVLNHGVKPVIEYVGAQSVVNIDTYAGVVEGIADEDLEDNPELENEIQMEAMYELSAAENTAANTLLTGVAQAYGNAAYGKSAYPDAKAALAGIVDQVRQALGNRVSPICLAMNSAQWAKLKDLRNTNGTPIEIQSIIGDVKVIVDNSLTTDNFLCWAQKFAKIKVYKAGKADWYKGVKVTTVAGNVTAVYSEWRTDESSLRVRQREALYVTDDTTVVKGTISGVITAITV